MTEQAESTEGGVVLLRESDIDRLRVQLAEARTRLAKIRAEVLSLETKVRAAEYLQKCITTGK